MNFVNLFFFGIFFGMTLVGIFEGVHGSMLLLWAGIAFVNGLSFFATKDD